MKAHNQNGLEIEAFEVAHECIRDAYGNAYLFDVFDGEHDLYTDGSDVLSVTRCECADTAGRYVNPSYDFVCVQRCDLCMRYASDEDACDAHVAMLNRVASELCFERVQVRIEEEEDTDSDRVYRASVGLTRADARGKELGHVAYRTECLRLGIDLSVACSVLEPEALDADA